ncbi:hypothetical protein Tco_0290346, partial [Tanacetum coccineum]
MRNKLDIDEIDIDDLYNNLRVYENEMKRSLNSTSTSQNLAFLSFKNTSSTNEISTASGDFQVSTARGISQVSTTPCAHDVACSFFTQPTTSPQLENNDFSRLMKMTWKNWIIDDRGLYGLGGYDWSNDFEVEPVNYALMAISSSSLSSSSDNEVQKCSKQCLESFKTLQKNFDSEREKHSRARLEIQGYELTLESIESRILVHKKNELAWGEKYESSDEENTLANDSFSKVDGFHAVSPPITGNFLTPRADISFTGKTNEANTQKPKTIYESVNRDKVIIEDWNSDDENDVSEVQTICPVKTNETQTVKTRVDKISQTSQKQGTSFKKIKACF